MRKGTEQVKHLETKDFWVQEVIRRKSIEVVRINRDSSPSDSMASYSAPGALRAHMDMLGCRISNSISLQCAK